MFYRRERIYESKIEKSYAFHEVCPKKLTLRKNLHKKISMHIIKDGWYHTIFNEVNVVPFNKAYEKPVKEFGEKKINRTPVSKKEFVELMFMILTDYIEKTWDPYKFHIIPHSSGYDSRLISTILKRLKKKNGSDWFGDYVFIESNGESELFKQMMQMEGWRKHIVMYEGKDPSEAHLHSFDFKNAWKAGLIGFPVNSWYSQVEWLQKMDIAPENVQCYTGYGANETTTVIHRADLYANANYQPEYKPNNLGLYFAWHYLHQLSAFTLNGDWIHPFYNLDYLGAFAKYSKGHIEHLHPGLSVSKVILEIIEPELAKIHKMVTKEVKKKGFFNVSDKIINQAIKDYKSSWYGKRNPIQPTNEIKYCEWWWSWRVASLCEHLLENGHDINANIQ